MKYSQDENKHSRSVGSLTFTDHILEFTQEQKIPLTTDLINSNDFRKKIVNVNEVEMRFDSIPSQ